jgi:formylglycine-generating enzyme required for sulfatase activity
MRSQLLICVALCSAISTPTLLARSLSSQKPTSDRHFKDCRDCPDLVVVPGGRFQMGSPAGEAGGDDTERPLHWVTVRRFAIGRFDVTRDEYAAFVNATKRSTKPGCYYTGRPAAPDIPMDRKGSWRSLGFPQTGRDPVVCVTWQDAHDYLAWLSKRTGHHYRLLSEAEWEYAARGGTRTPYYWGSKADHEHANYGPDHGYGKGLAKGRDRWIFTSPGGAFPPNPFGLYDMSGNVLQMVEDCFHPNYDGAPTDGSPNLDNGPLHATGYLAEINGLPACSYRVLRGGDWGDPPDVVRPAMRNLSPGPGQTLADARSGGVGFRVAREP